MSLYAAYKPHPNQCDSIDEFVTKKSNQVWLMSWKWNICYQPNNRKNIFRLISINFFSLLLHSVLKCLDNGINKTLCACCHIKIALICSTDFVVFQLKCVLMVDWAIGFALLHWTLDLNKYPRIAHVNQSLWPYVLF